MLKKIVSGGQTGADQAGLKAAQAAGIETGGWAPKGWTTEKGAASWLADYGLAEHPEPDYPPRTEANVRDSDGTAWFGRTDSAGFRTTTDACRKHDKPWFVVVEGRTTPKQVIDWLTEHDIATLNIAGNRESKNRGLALRTERFLAQVFRGLGT
jgi:hypothetical protein